MNFTTISMMTTFDNKNMVIVYPLENITSYIRSNQYLFFDQSVWWISSICGLQQGLVIYINNLSILFRISNKNIHIAAIVHLE